MTTKDTNILGKNQNASQAIPTLSIGIVRDNADPAQEGRLKIYVPSVDSQYYKLEDLPWADYVTPFGGSTADFLVGREKKKVSGVSSYGMWAIPKNNAQVLVAFLDGNPNQRIWMGCFYTPEYMRTLPQSINPIKSEIDDSGNYPQETMTHYQENLAEAGLGEGTLHWETRGGYERSVSHPSNKNKDKPTDDGYWTKPLEEDKADSQAISITSPGRHFMVMSDVDEHCRIRIKTTEGSQIIFDDTNERIYMSTAKGRNWVELDETNGKIYIYSDSKINIRSKNDINFYSDNNINMVAKNRVNIQSEEAGVKIQAKNVINLDSSEADIKLQASRDISLKTTNGPRAEAIEEKEECVLPVSHLAYTWQEDGGSETSKIRIQAHDSIELTSDEDQIRALAKKSIHLKAQEGSFRLQVEEDIDIKTSNFRIEAMKIMSQKVGKHIVEASEEATVMAQSIVLESENNVSASGKDFLTTFSADFISGIETEAHEKIISGNNGDNALDSEDVEEAEEAEEALEVTTEVVTEKMVRPDHESWERDEDEEKCETPRNDNWIS